MDAALPLPPNGSRLSCGRNARGRKVGERPTERLASEATHSSLLGSARQLQALVRQRRRPAFIVCNRDRKSTRLNSSHVSSLYAVFCLKKKTPSFAARPSSSMPSALVGIVPILFIASFGG